MTPRVAMAATKTNVSNIFISFPFLMKFQHPNNRETVFQYIKITKNHLDLQGLYFEPED
jgi:hypothetical protein